MRTEERVADCSGQEKARPGKTSQKAAFKLGLGA